MQEVDALTLTHIELISKKAAESKIRQASNFIASTLFNRKKTPGISNALTLSSCEYARHPQELFDTSKTLQCHNESGANLVILVSWPCSVILDWTNQSILINHIPYRIQLWWKEIKCVLFKNNQSLGNNNDNFPKSSFFWATICTETVVVMIQRQ